MTSEHRQKIYEDRMREKQLRNAAPELLAMLRKVYPYIAAGEDIYSTALADEVSLTIRKATGGDP